MTNIEHNFRHAHDHHYGDERPAESSVSSSYWPIIILLTLGILCIATAIISSRDATSSPRPQPIVHTFEGRWLYLDALDIAFEKHVEEETRKVCSYRCEQGRNSMFPECRMVCRKGGA